MRSIMGAGRGSLECTYNPVAKDKDASIIYYSGNSWRNLWKISRTN